VLQQELSKLNQTSAEAESSYAGKSSCMDQYRTNVGTVSNLANNALSNVEAILVKAEYGEKLQNDPCTRESEEAKKILQNSANVIGKISNELTNNDAKGGNLFDLAQPATLQQLERWKSQVTDESRNFQALTERLSLSYKNNPSCTAYADLISESVSKGTEGVSTAARLIALISKSTSLQGNKGKSSIGEESLPESEGIEEEPEANLTVTFSNSQNRFIIYVESNLPEETLTIRATKRGAKSLRFTVNTDEVGSGGIRTRSKLNGYSLVLSFGSIKLDAVRVR
jgi:hypothetical protein